MFGGVSKSYVNWAIQGEPYKKGQSWYVKVKHPKYNMAKEVRWYCDKEHAEMMPDYAPPKPFYTVFGFKDINDKVKCIRKIDLTEQEEDQFFHYNWDKFDKENYWRFGCFFETTQNLGVWYAPQEAPDFPIKNKDKVFLADWQTFKSEGQKHSKAIGATTDYWFRED